MVLDKWKVMLSVINRFVHFIVSFLYYYTLNASNVFYGFTTLFYFVLRAYSFGDTINKIECVFL